MVEKNLVINNRELRYKGIFHVNELFSSINKSLEHRGYAKNEKKTEELVTEDGRRTYVELRPAKVKTAYVKLMIKMRIELDKVTEVTEEDQGRKKRWEKGDITIHFDSWVMTDYESRWGMRPWFFFMKGLVNKYIYTTPLEAGFPGELVSDTAYIYAQIRKLLRSYGPDEGEEVKESEIQEQVAKDIAEAEKDIKNPKKEDKPSDSKDEVDSEKNKL